MKKLNKYYLKLTTLSPVHIGTGEAYEPTSFVIDKGLLYVFDEVLFYKSLSELDRKSLNVKLNDWMQIIDFYKNHIDQAKKIYENSVIVTKKVENKYNTTFNKDGTKNKNQLEIHKIFKNPNTHRAIIPGSSLKGMFDTVLHIYSKPEVASNEVRQKLIVSDALLLDGQTEIGYCYRKHKDSSKSAKSAIPQMVEIIKKGSTFILSVSTEKSFEDIKTMMSRYHQDRKDSIFQEDANSFIARVGKFSGKEYMVDDGRNVKNSFGKPIATHTLYENDSPFGWIMIEKIDKKSFEQNLETIKKQEESYYLEKEMRQKEIKKQIQKAEQEAKEKALQKQKLREEEERRRKKEQEEKEARVAAMSPLDRKIEELKAKTPGAKIATIILNGLQQGEFAEFDRCEVLQALRRKMQEANEWKETTEAKKPEKDKEFKCTQEVINMLKECE